MGIDISLFLISVAEYLINYFVLSSVILLLLILALKLNALKADRITEKLIKIAIIMAIIAPFLSVPTALDDLFISRLEPSRSLIHSESSIEQATGQETSDPESANVQNIKGVRPSVTNSISKLDSQLVTHNNPVIGIEAGRVFNDSYFKRNRDVSVSVSDSMVKALVLTWTVGLILMAGIRLYQYKKLQSLLYQRNPVKDVMLFAGLSELKQSANFDNDIKISSSPLLTSPIVMSHALFSQKHGEIVVPTTFVTRFNSAQQQAALAHEIAHLKRGDMIWQKLFVMIDIVFFFQPLHRILRKVLAQITEQQSDELATIWTGDPKALAEALAVTASQHITNKHTKWVLAMKTEKSDLLLRVERLMSERKERTGNSIVTLSVLILMALFFAIPGCSLSRSESLDSAATAGMQKTESTQNTEPTPTSRPGALVSDHEQQISPGLFVYRGGSVPNTRPRSFHRIEDDDGSNQLEASAYSGDTFWSLDADLSGKIIFNDAETQITEFPANSSMEVKLDDGVNARKLLIKRDSGDVQYTYYKNREQVLFEQDNQWFSVAIPELLRMTGWYAQQRVQKILANKGVDAVLAEISLIAGDYGKSRYLKFLSYHADLSPDHIDNAIGETATISSDFEQSEVLKMLMRTETLSGQNWLNLLTMLNNMESDFQLAETLTEAMAHMDKNKQQLNEDVLIAYFNAMETIQSDFQLAQLLSKVVKDQNLPVSHVGRLLATAQSIQSDFELAGLLIAAIAEDVIVSDSWSVFFETAQMIQSDFEMRRLFVSLSESNVSNDVLLDMLDLAAKEVQSDNELGQLLMSVMSDKTLTSDLKHSIELALDSIQSSSVRQRVENQLQQLAS